MPLRRWQLLLLLVGLLVAGFLPTLAFSGNRAVRGTGTTVSLVAGGVTTTMSSAALEKAITAGTTPSAAAGGATIIIVVNGRVVVKSPYRDFAVSAARNMAMENVRTSIAPIEFYGADNHPNSPHDPDPATSTTDSGYSGMTVTLLARAYDKTLLHDHLKLFRVSRTSYCVQSTIGGQTAFKNGPLANLALGHC